MGPRSATTAVNAEGIPVTTLGGTDEHGRAFNVVLTRNEATPVAVRIEVAGGSPPGVRAAVASHADHAAA